MAPWKDCQLGWSWEKMWEDESATSKAEERLDYQWAKDRNRKRDIKLV